MPDETDMPLPVIPVNLPDDTQATESVASAIVEAVAPPEAVAPSSAPVEEEKAPEEARTEPPAGTPLTAEELQRVQSAPLVDAPATGVPLVGVEVPADGIMREFTLDASPALQLANMQHELAAAHDAAVNAQAAHDRVKDAHDKLLAEFQAAAEELEMRRALPSTEHFQAQIDSLQQRLTESDAKVQALTEERDLLKATQPEAAQPA